MTKPASAKGRMVRDGAKRRSEKTGTAQHAGHEREGGAQYTVRDVPNNVDRALRRKARDEGKSLNQVLRDALANVAEPADASAAVHHDLDHLAGTWEHDPEFEHAIAAQDRVDESLWR